MVIKHPSWPLVAIFSLLFAGTTFSAPPEGKGKPDKGGGGDGGGSSSLNQISNKDWDLAAVHQVLRVFAYGGHASPDQEDAWANMKPDQAITQILTFEVNNPQLSPPEDALAGHCGSLQGMQEFLATSDSDNPLRSDDIQRFQPLDSNSNLSLDNLQRTYTRAATTRGCNPFLLKTAFYLTNYHGSIHERNTGHALIREYFDDYMDTLSLGGDMIEVLTVGASHAAVARAYRHQYNAIRSDGTLSGNEDFAREYFQLFFGIPGTTIDQDYYETITIKNNGRLLTGMNIDQEPGRHGSLDINDHYYGPIDFTNHTDLAGRYLGNTAKHYDSAAGAASCLEMLETDICGATAGDKLWALGTVAANHPEAMDNIPVKIVEFFADDAPSDDTIARLRGSWADADHDVLTFLRQYAISRAFHAPDRIKHLTAFDRNLFIQNRNVLNNQEIYSMVYWRTAHDRMRRQGMKIFEPIRNVFGHQTGVDAANNPYIFRDAFYENWFDPGALADTSRNYTAADGSPQSWTKSWGAVIPADRKGRHYADEVAEWLWQRFIGDDLANFDSIARAQVMALLVEGVDFALSVDPGNTDPDTVYTSAQIDGADSAANDRHQINANTQLDLGLEETNRRIGLAVNFITMTPYAFAMEGQ